MVHSWGNFVKGTAAVVLLYGTMAFVLFLQPYLAENVRVGRTCRKSLCVTVIFNAAIYLITLGIFGSGMLPKMKYPAITLMSMIKLPGGFFERQDAFMVAIWFFTIYAFINTGMFYASDLLKAVWQKEGHQKADGKNICSHITFLPATGVENNVYMDSGNCISSVDGNSSAVHWRDK